MGKILREELYKIMEMYPKDSTHFLISKEIIERLNLGEPLNSSKIADKTFTSRPTVVRFAQSFGFEGFKEFSKELRKQNEEFFFEFKNKTFEDSFNEYEFHIKEIISDFSKSKDTFIDIAQEIKTHKKVFIFSSYENILIAKNFADKLSFLGIKAYCVFNQQILFLNMIKNGDLLLFIASGLDNKTMQTLWDYLNFKTITVLIGTPVQQLKFLNADYTIKIAAADNDILREQLKSFLFNYVLDQIYNLLIFSEKHYFERIRQNTFWRII